MKFKRYHVSKNVMPAGEQKTIEDNGITFSSDGKGKYSISGTATAYASARFNLLSAFTTPISVSNGGQGTLSFFNTQSDNNVTFYFYNATTKVDDWKQTPSNRVSTSYNVIGNKYVDSIMITVNSGATVNLSITPEFTNNGVLPSEFEPYSSEVWHDTPHYIHNTSTDTTTTLPAVLYPNNTYLSVELEGNSVQNGTPSPSSPVDVSGVGDESDVPTYIVNAHIDGVSIQKAFKYSELCELTAPNKPSEYFSYWKDENNNILSYNQTFTQRIAMDRNIYATYSNVEVAPQPCLEMYLYNAIKDGGNNLYWLFFGEVPDNYSVVEEGIMYTANRTAGYTQDSTVDLTTVPGFDFDAVWADSSKYRVDKYTGTVNIFTQVFNLFIGDSVNNYFYGKGYITIKNNTTQEQSTIYSDMVKGTYNNTNLRPTPIIHYNIPITCSNITYNRYLSGTESIRYIKKLVLTGDETIAPYDPTYNRFAIIIQDSLIVGVRLSPAICSHYQVISDGRSITSVPNNAIYSDSGNGRWFIKTTDITTVADFKTYLQQQYAAGTPVIVWYALAEPETGIVNEPLMKIGDYADSLSGISIPTTPGANTLDVDTTVAPSEVTANYSGWHPVTSAHERESGAWT